MKAKPNQLKKWNPARRFKQVPETIIHSTHSGSSNLDRDSIKVLSWNIAKNNYNPNWSKEFSTIVEQYQPDKIFLQEVRLSADVPEIAELAEMGWAFAPNFIDTFNNAYSGILIASKGDYALKDTASHKVSRRHRLSKQVVVTKHFEPVINTPKISLFAEYSSSDCGASRRHRPQSLLTVNTHLIKFVGLSKFKAQLQEIELILKEHQGAVILAGDFNTWNKSRWQILCQMAARLNLTSVSFTAEDTMKIKSFLFSPPLDYIFYRGFTPKLNTAKVIGNISASDHNALFVELCLNKN